MREDVKLTNCVVADDVKKQKKEFRKTIGHMAWGLVIYTVIGIIISVILVFVKVCISVSNKNKLNITEKEMDEILKNIESQEFYGLLSCVIVLVGIIFMFIYFRNYVDKRQMFSVHKRMSFKNFVQILCVFLGVQFLVEPIFLLLEKIFNFLGYSIISSMDSATMYSGTLVMFLYAVILGPIVEELVYRGFVLYSIEKYGKIYAIIVSAFLFGLMHENIPQSVFACVVGVILGYVTIEYSIWWAILLHIINNGLTDVLIFLTKGYSEKIQETVYNCLFGVCFLMGISIIWKKRMNIHEYLKQNKFDIKKILYTFTVIGMIIFIVMETWAAFSMIEKLG